MLSEFRKSLEVGGMEYLEWIFSSRHGMAIAIIIY
jgi:hypothetical protein